MNNRLPPPPAPLTHCDIFSMNENGNHNNLLPRIFSPIVSPCLPASHDVLLLTCDNTTRARAAHIYPKNKKYWELIYSQNFYWKKRGRGERGVENWWKKRSEQRKSSVASRPKHECSNIHSIANKHKTGWIVKREKKFHSEFMPCIIETH